MTYISKNIVNKDKVKEFMELLDIPEEEVLQALLSAFGAPSPGAIRQNWTRLTTFGNEAPTTAELQQKFVDADFRCGKCGSQHKVTIQHKDGNATNHKLDNLEVWCFQCNRGDSSKATETRNKQTKVYLIIMQYWKKHKKVPKESEIQKIMGIKTNIDYYRLKWLKTILEGKKGNKFTETLRNVIRTLQ